MITLNIHPDNSRDILHEIAREYDLPVTGNRLLINNGELFLDVRIEEFEGLFDLIITRECIIHEPVRIFRHGKLSNNFFPVLFIDAPAIEFKIPELGNVHVGSESLHGVSFGMSSEPSEMFLPLEKKFRFLSIRLKPEYIRSFEKDSKFTRYILHSDQDIIIHEMITLEMKKLIGEIHENADDDSFGRNFRKVRAEELIMQFLHKVDKRDFSVKSKQGKIKTDAYERIYKVREKLLEDLSKQPAMDELAEEAALSPSRMRSVFKEVFGMPVYSYLQEARLEEARNLILNSDYSISSISYLTGFSNPGHFASLFKNKFGMLPSEWKKA
ncbi:helix-turn-helix transcriptional regulator [Marinigracilibium pacificum]|uniref:Helix-turn-helix transcriptional regulator n=1 Tax=Marinigracilibium pacificum TaxID=2729599 RepID=A0A848J137_9BACT|nr:AraC family transcriptional regulator [Marinigracilibium pacificum]NMM49068.1 helix-turn-helix transcriptional regulator [Marinigracilibium pacificum]